jgi:hypothetical protein
MWQHQWTEVTLRKVCSAESILEIAHLRNILEAAGIACVVRNEKLAGALGELPLFDCWPELWVIRNGDQLRARGLVDCARDLPQPRGPDWQCPRCGELVEAQFDECWRCAPPVEADLTQADEPATK